MEVVSLLLVFLAGLLSGIANTIAGGGSILTVPLLILLGLPPVVANGTNRVAILVQCLSAMIGFRQYNILHLRNISSYVIPSLVGAFIGAVIGVQIPDTLFKKIFALFMILALLFFFVKKEQGDKKRSAKKKFYTTSSFLFYWYLWWNYPGRCWICNHLSSYTL